MSTSEGWFLYGPTSGPRTTAQLVREAFNPGSPGPTEVVAEPLYGSWEGNMTHAISRSPIDVCHQRGEPRVVLGNAGVVRVTEVGSEVRSLREGDVAVLYSGSAHDEFGYPTKILGFDAPRTMGCLAKRIVLPELNLIRLPENTRYPLPRWAAFSVKYISAWSNWRLAYHVYRASVPQELDPNPFVWGWGGGTTFGELDLARREGCRVAMLSGNSDRLSMIARAGMDAIDRRQFGALSYDAQRAAKDMTFYRNYMRAENSFHEFCKERTLQRGVQIFIDYIGLPVIRATLRVLSREGVVATAGWKEGMNVSYLRASACISRQQHVNTHYATRKEAESAVAFAEETGWLPPVDGPIHSFDDVPKIAADHARNEAGLFVVYRVQE